jgi:hypothetical protein
MFYCDPCAEQRDWPIDGDAYKSMGRCEICERPTACNDRQSRLLAIPTEEQLAAVEARRTRVEQLTDPNRGNCLVSGLSIHEILRTMEHADLDSREWALSEGAGVEGLGIYLQRLEDAGL